MRGDLTTRKVKTASGATAVQVVRNEGKRCVIIKHIGSAHNESECDVLLAKAEKYAEEHRRQPNLFATPLASPNPLPQRDLSKVWLVGVTHLFARNALLSCARKCGLDVLPNCIWILLSCASLNLFPSCVLWSFYSDTSMFVMLNGQFIECYPSFWSIRRRSRMLPSRQLVMRFRRVSVWCCTMSPHCISSPSRSTTFRVRASQRTTNRNSHKLSLA